MNLNFDEISFSFLFNLFFSEESKPDSDLDEPWIMTVKGLHFNNFNKNALEDALVSGVGGSPIKHNGTSNANSSPNNMGLGGMGMGNARDRDRDRDRDYNLNQQRQEQQQQQQQKSSQVSFFFTFRELSKSN